MLLNIMSILFFFILSGCVSLETSSTNTRGANSSHAKLAQVEDISQQIRVGRRQVAAVRSQRQPQAVLRSNSVPEEDESFYSHDASLSRHSQWKDKHPLRQPHPLVRPATAKRWQPIPRTRQIAGTRADHHLAQTTKHVAHPQIKYRHYTVEKGDTLYSIAFNYGLDFKYLARVNQLPSPYAIHPGDALDIPPEPSLPAPNDLPKRPTLASKQPLKAKNKPSTGVLSAKNKNKIKVTKIAADNKTVAALKGHRKTVFKQKTHAKSKHKVTKLKNNFKFSENPVHSWIWPVEGKVIKCFSSGRVGNKGIDIAGKLRQPIKAISSGKVVYSGSGLRGYGNLIIIKHNDRYLSAYAYNKELLVKEGSMVKAGQVIAKMGHAENGKVMLHFEIRRNGKPVNPLRYLRSKRILT